MKKHVQKDQTLLEFLETMYPDSSRRTLRHWLKARRVTVDAAVATHSTLRVQKGQLVCVDKTPKTPSHLHAIKNVTILYEDPDIVIISKPMGLLSVPLDRSPSKNALSILREYYKTAIFAVHRIDRKTSGALVFAKTEEARTGMDTLFRNHDITREYLAIVEGKLSSPQGTWKSHLVEHTPFEVRTTQNPEKGKLAITHYEVLRTSAKFTYLRLILETGRKHQIRVHCQEAGHPILGDKRYGSTMNPHKRISLHAHRIAFKHPITGKHIDITAKPSGIFWVK